MGRFIQLVVNALTVGGLLVGAIVLLFNLVFSPAWQDANFGLIPSHPIRWLVYAENSPLNQPRVVQTVCLWARLDPLPHSTRHLIVDSSGELFDKRYTVSFQADADDIYRWLAASAGTASQIDLHPPLSGDRPTADRHYKIEPRDAAFAEVTVLADQHTVKIKAAWSSPAEEPLRS